MKSYSPSLINKEKQIELSMSFFWAVNWQKMKYLVIQNNAKDAGGRNIYPFYRKNL